MAAGSVITDCRGLDAMEFPIVRDPGREGKGTMVPSSNGKLLGVRYRSHATHSRQPRQVRKEATVTSSGVCSGFPVPGFFSLKIKGRLVGDASSFSSQRWVPF